MATEIGSLVYDLSIKSTNLSKGLDDADKSVKNFGDKVGIMSEQMQSGFKKAAAGLAVVGVGLTAYAKNATDFTKDLVGSAKSLGREIGVNTIEASRLVAAFGRMGISADAAKTTFGIFAKQIVASTTASETNRLATEKLNIQIDQTKKSISDITTEIKKNGDKSGDLTLKLRDLNNTLSLQKEALNQSADGFVKLGISTKDAAGKQKDFSSLLFEVADKFKAMPDGIDKTALSMQLFGRSGKDMIKVLNLGSDGIQDLERQADKLGLTLNANTVYNISKLITAQKNLKQETDAMKIAVGTATAPVLASFDTAINRIVSSIVNSHGPLHTIGVDILAFGGPVASAASGLFAFLATLAQSTGALKVMGGALSGVMGLLQSPWVLAIAAAGLAIGVLTSYFMNHKSTTEQLKTAQDNLRSSTDLLHTAQTNLASASLGLVGANLAVEQAQLAYNDAVKQFGPNSLQARTALYQLQQSQLNVKIAQEQTKTAQEELHQKELEVAKDKTLIKHLQETSREVDNVWGKALRAGDQLNGLNGRKITVKTSKNAAGQEVIDFVGTFGAKAKGGAVRAGLPYMVGEKGPELVFPNTDGFVMKASDSALLTKNLQSVARGSSTSYGDTIVNIGTVQDRSDADYILRRIDRNTQLESLGLSPVGG